MRLLSRLLAVVAVAALAPLASAEPAFLSRQYARCTNCHYSATGGGLLTPYGRSLSRQELSTFGASPVSAPAGREQEFLFGALGDATGPLHLGIDLRPSHLAYDGPGYSSSRDILMNADVQAALTLGGWTFYGELGRQPRSSGTVVTSFEHWVGWKSEKGLGVRAGRFLPAYGIHLPDHTSFTRAPLGLDNENQVYAVELSYAGDRQLVQVSAGPGYADSVDDASERAFTAAGRWQVDLTPRVVAVASGRRWRQRLGAARRGILRGVPRRVAARVAPAPDGIRRWQHRHGPARRRPEPAPAHPLERGADVLPRPGPGFRPDGAHAAGAAAPLPVGRPAPFSRLESPHAEAARRDAG
jgi:hypothetical protein